jgi:hypothetical protein
MGSAKVKYIIIRLSLFISRYFSVNQKVVTNVCDQHINTKTIFVQIIAKNGINNTECYDVSNIVSVHWKN